MMKRYFLNVLLFFCATGLPLHGTKVTFRCCDKSGYTYFIKRACSEPYRNGLSIGSLGNLQCREIVPGKDLELELNPEDVIQICMYVRLPPMFSVFEQRALGQKFKVSALQGNLVLVDKEGFKVQTCGA